MYVQHTYNHAEEYLCNSIVFYMPHFILQHNKGKEFSNLIDLVICFRFSWSTTTGSDIGLVHLSQLPHISQFNDHLVVHMRHQAFLLHMCLLQYLYYSISTFSPVTTYLPILVIKMLNIRPELRLIGLVGCTSTLVQTVSHQTRPSPFLDQSPTY